MFSSGASQVSSSKLYVDDVFSAYTYTGNATAGKAITNGIDLAANGGLVWITRRDAANGHMLFRDVAHSCDSSTTGAEVNLPNDLSAYTSSGFTLGFNANANASGGSYASWTFRNADKFHGHTTVTKSSGSNATASFSNLGTLGMVRVKRTDAAGSWYVWHRSLTAGKLLIGETTAAEATLGHITVSGTTVTLVNGVIADGGYLVEAFAHDTSADGIIQCGSFTTDGSGKFSVSCGFETQFVMIKRTDSTSNWFMMDTSRGMSYANTEYLSAQSSGAAANDTVYVIKPTATGFDSTVASVLPASSSWIYLAIRRPNKPPTTGTQVYNAIARTGTSAAATVTGVGFPPDLAAVFGRSAYGPSWWDRLRGASRVLFPTGSSAESGALTDCVTEFQQDGIKLGADTIGPSGVNASGITTINHFFRRAPGVFDVVCWTSTNLVQTINHSLGVKPSLIFLKERSGTAWGWCVAADCTLGYSIDPWYSDYHLNTTAAAAHASGSVIADASYVSASWIKTAFGAPGVTCVSYIFATLPGVSKVFSFTGNGTNQNIDCGFSAGARFVLLKRTDSTGNWLVADTARGLVSGNDPSLALNSTAAEVTTLDWIDPYAGGFNIVQESTNNANVNGATYIGLAIS